jgi:starch phosphorylase
MQALAYDVPIPGYMTKNTISLRIWEAKAPPQDFDLYSFNAGEHEKAAILQSKANQVNLLVRC